LQLFDKLKVESNRKFKNLKMIEKLFERKAYQSNLHYQYTNSSTHLTPIFVSRLCSTKKSTIFASKPDN